MRLLCLCVLVVLVLLSGQCIAQEDDAYEYYYEEEGAEEAAKEPIQEAIPVVDVEAGAAVAAVDQAVNVPPVAVEVEVNGGQATDASYDGYEYEYEEEGEAASTGGAVIEAKATATGDLLIQQQQQQQQQYEEQLQRELLQQQQQQQQQQQATHGRGYKKNVGAGLVRVGGKIASDRFIKVVMEAHGCLLQKDVGVKVMAKNSTKIMRQMKEEEREQNVTAAAEQASATAAAAGGGSGAASTTGAGDGKAKPAPKEKKLTFREIQEIKVRERREAEQAREALKGKFQLGTSCEGLICGACKIIVEEFAVAVVQGENDPKYVYVDDVMGDFCRRREMMMQYSELVSTICMNIHGDRVGYREALVVPFEEHDQGGQDQGQGQGGNLATITSPANVFAKKRQICTAIGACQESHFEMITTSTKKERQHWDDKCYVCQAFANDLEERLQLTLGITEGSVVNIVKGACNRLGITPELQEVCAPLTNGALLDDISWIAKVHGELLLKKPKGEVLFADKMCEEIKYCTKYLDEEELKRQEAAKIEPVFF